MDLKRCAALLAVALGTALAANARADVAVTLDAGSTGAGMHLVIPMETYLNGRFGVNYYKHDVNTRSRQIDYTADARLRTVDVLFDWYAFNDSQFRLTGGVVYNGNQIVAQGRANAQGNYVINGRHYAAKDVGTLDGKVDFQRAAPYFGIGWGNALTPNRRWNFSGDLGAFYMGNAHVRLDSVGCKSNAIVCAVLASDVKSERTRLAEELRDHKFFPVLRASLSYSF